MLFFGDVVNLHGKPFTWIDPPPPSPPTAPCVLSHLTSHRSPIAVPDGINDYRIRLGQLGREDDGALISDGSRVGGATNRAVRSWVPLLEAHLAGGTLKPLEYEVVTGEAYEAAVEAVKRQEKGGLSRKLVVRIQEA